MENVSGAFDIMYRYVAAGRLEKARGGGVRHLCALYRISYTGLRLLWTLSADACRRNVDMGTGRNSYGAQLQRAG